MDRHFLVPATIAAAIHAGLLFGLGRHGPAIPPAVVKPVTILTEFILPPEPPPPPELETAMASAGGGTPRPGIDEPPPTIAPPDAITIAYDPAPVAAPDIRSEMIPKGPPGIGEIEGIDRPGVGNGVLRIGDLDSTPRTRITATPAYPFEASKAGLNGEVMVEFEVDETGAVHSPKVVRSSDRVFEDPALRAVARWKFEPGKKGGKPVRFRMALPIVFSLNGE